MFGNLFKPKTSSGIVDPESFSIELSALVVKLNTAIHDKYEDFISDSEDLKTGEISDIEVFNLSLFLVSASFMLTYKRDNRSEVVDNLTLYSWVNKLGSSDKKLLSDYIRNYQKFYVDAGDLFESFLRNEDVLNCQFTDFYCNKAFNTNSMINKIYLGSLIREFYGDTKKYIEFALEKY